MMGATILHVFLVHSAVLFSSDSLGVSGKSLVVCSQKKFNAMCKDKYISIESAWYGRKKSKCVDSSEEECGCDATRDLRELCGGLNNCSKEVLDKHVSCQSSCSKDLKHHLYVTYGCTENPNTSNTWIIAVGCIGGFGFILLLYVCCFCCKQTAKYLPVPVRTTDQNHNAGDNKSMRLTTLKEDMIPSNRVELHMRDKCGTYTIIEITNLLPVAQRNKQHTDYHTTSVSTNEQQTPTNTDSTQQQSDNKVKSTVSTEETSAAASEPGQEGKNYQEEHNHKGVTDTAEGNRQHADNHTTSVSTSTKDRQAQTNKEGTQQESDNEVANNGSTVESCAAASESCQKGKNSREEHTSTDMAKNRKVNGSGISTLENPTCSIMIKVQEPERTEIKVRHIKTTRYCCPEINIIPLRVL